MAGLAGPLAGLSLILCCSIVVGFAFDVSWKAGVPLLFLMSGVGVGAGVCVARSEMIRKHLRTVLSVATPLALLSIVPTVLSLILEIRWAFVIPCGVLLICFTAIATLALCHSEIQVNDPFVNLSLLVGFSILSGVVMELTWIGGGLVMIGLVGIVVWPCISVLFHMKRDSPITTFAIMASIVLFSGVASINASIYAPFGFITLNVVMVAATPVVCLLLACQSDKIIRNCRVLVAITALLTLICIASTALCYSVTWHTIIPNALFLACSSILLHYRLHETDIINNAMLRFACLFMFPMLGFSSIIASATFVISFFFLAVFGTSMIVSAFYFEAAAIALFLICTVDMYVHSITAYQWKEIKKCPRLIVAVSAPLTLLGVVATGLFLTIEPKLALPCGLFLLYAIVCLSVGLCESKAIKSNVTAVIILIVLLASTTSAFVSYFLAPLWSLVAFLATVCSVPLLIFTDFNTNKDSSGLYGCYSDVLLLVITASHGLSLTAEMPIGWSLFLFMALLTVVVLQGLQWTLLQYEVTLIISYHYVISLLPVLIPFTFVAIAALCILAAYILFCFREEHRTYIAYAGLFILLIFIYCFCLFVALAGKPGARLPGFDDHCLGCIVSISLCVHCFIIAYTGDLAAEDRKKAAAATAAPPPVPAAPPVAVVVQRDVDSDYDSGDDACGGHGIPGQAGGRRRKAYDYYGGFQGWDFRKRRDVKA
ncbi:hypothetical protein PRIPAC_94173 [Pristionchus pacificus]|uniref:Uncharacterized protein n=1 Tax=Pristionchus pacificus TaxID=54126 RepID=A0A2A6BPK8_PRIPA|nr:hypothetical protein PRIPAC_94173 [Pristionchus pacificus]|eukprot:PDM67849.1 hypothetical protein PRIPAC_45893 [Pristionchus pacificus]